MLDKNGYNHSGPLEGAWSGLFAVAVLHSRIEINIKNSLTLFCVSSMPVLLPQLTLTESFQLPQQYGALEEVFNCQGS